MLRWYGPPGVRLTLKWTMPVTLTLKSAAKPWMFASPDEGFRPRSHSVCGAPVLQFSATIAFAGVRHGLAAFTVTHGLMSPRNDPTTTHTTNRKTTTHRSCGIRVRIRVLDTEHVDDSRIEQSAGRITCGDTKAGECVRYLPFGGLVRKRRQKSPAGR